MRKKNRRNLIKRSITAAFAAVLLLLLPACSYYENGDAQEDSRFSFSTLDVIPVGEDAAENTGSVALPEEFRIISERDSEKNFFADAEDQDIMSKTVFERNSRLFTEYGVTMTSTSVIDIVSYVKTAMLANDPGYDMMIVTATSASTLMTSGALADLGSVAGFDSGAKGYSTNIMTDLSLGGRTYLAAGDATPSLLRSASAVIVNTDLLSRIEGGSDLMKNVRNGNFTYEMMLTLSGALEALNGGGTAPSSYIKAGAEKALALYKGGGGSFFADDSVTDMPCAVDLGGENREIYRAVMSLYGIETEESGGDAEISFSSAATPLFTVADISTLESLAEEGAPFAALPMPKMSASQSEYVSTVDLTRVSFTALPAGVDNTSSAAVMNLIYKLSDSVVKVITDKCEGIGTENSRPLGTVTMVKDSLSAELLSMFGYGDLDALMTDCVNQRLSGKVFEIRGSERSRAAVAALSIVINNLNNN